MNTSLPLLFITYLFSGICYAVVDRYTFIPVIIKDLPCYSNIRLYRGEEKGHNYTEEKLSVIILNQDSKKICKISGENKLSEFGVSFGIFPVDNAAAVAKSIEKAVHFISIAEKYDVVINAYPVGYFEPTKITIYDEMSDNRFGIIITKHPKFSESCVKITSTTSTFIHRKDTLKTDTSICLTKKEALELASALKTASIKANNGDRVAAEIKCIDK